jgi:ribosomal protein L37AE/L43A
MVQLARPTACPECDSWKVARILYGTEFDEHTLERDLADGRAVLGGTWIKHAPKWECQDCHHRWGGAPPLERHALLFRERAALRREFTDLIDED